MASPTELTPLVFLHAFPLDGSMWKEANRFSDRQTLAPDFPGFGAHPAAAPNLDDFADAVAEAMDNAAISRAVLVGLSMGGYVAFRFHARYPERVAGLVLADTRAGADTAEAAAKRTAQAERARREGIAWLADEMLPNLLGTTSRNERPHLVEAIRRVMDSASAEGVAQALIAMRERPDSTPALPSIDVPVLALAGAEDAITPPSEARLIADRTPRGRLAEIPRAGHLSALENPEAFTAVLRDFIASVDARNGVPG